MWTRTRFFEQRSALTTRENATVATDGSRMLSVQFWTGDVARTPLGVTALLRAKQLAWCTPTPCTASCVLGPALNWYGEPSSEHSIPLTPLGPAVAVAVMY